MILLVLKIVKSVNYFAIFSGSIKELEQQM